MPPAPRTLLLVGLLAALLTGCSGRRSRSVGSLVDPIESSELGGMRNVYLVGRLWFGAVPGVADLELARRRGVTRVIDLCSPDEATEVDLASACRSLGLEYLGGMIPVEELEGDDSVDLVLSWLGSPPDDGEEPWTLMYDGTGGRCAAYLAIHRVVGQGVELDEALVEARRAGMKPGLLEELVRAQVARLTSTEEAPVSERAPAR